MSDATEPGLPVPPIRVLIVDDHRLFRVGLRALLATVDDVEVVGEAADGVTAVEAALRLHPDLVLMDLHMPGGSGLDAMRQLSGTGLGINLLVLTMLDDDESVFAAVRAGGRGYVLKDADSDELVQAVRTVGRGGAIYSAAVAGRMSDLFTQVTAGAGAASEPFPGLTPAERRVLAEMARGLNNDAIAEVLGYSPKTIRNYVSIIFAKLHVADRAQAIILARDQGLT